EDFHSAETEAALDDSLECTLIHSIERENLARCRHITASSPNIARAYAAKYGVPDPVPILNVFSLADAPASPGLLSRDPPLRLYWFSQTIGSNRGLEPLLRILASMRAPAELHLRGLESPGFRETMSREARRAGFGGRIALHSLAPPNEMVRLAQPYHFGLSV